MKRNCPYDSRIRIIIFIAALNRDRNCWNIPYLSLLAHIGLIYREYRLQMICYVQVHNIQSLNLKLRVKRFKAYFSSKIYIVNPTAYEYS